MIKNDRQFKYTKKRLAELQDGLKAIHKKYSSDKNKLSLLTQGYKEHVAQLTKEAGEYEKIKKLPLPHVLRAHDPLEISHQLARLRIARGFTQAQLAGRIGCKQSDVSRLEREEYRGYTITQLTKIAKSLNAKIELNLIPIRKAC